MTLRLLSCTVLALLALAGTAQAQNVGTPEGLLEWMGDHPGKAGLVVLDDRGRPVVAHAPRDRFPLASVRKVLVAGALTASGERLSTRVPRATVERYYAPGTDGGAHEQADLHPTRPTLRQLATAALTVSDNAAADTLLDRVGARRVDAWARRQGLRRQDPIFGYLGELGAWMRDPRWTDRTPAGRARVAAELQAGLTGAEITTPAIPEQERLVRSSVRGTPGEWARLMRRIARRGDRRLVRLLDWPRANPDVRRGFSRFLAKGGTFPGVTTEVAYARPRGGRGFAVALFLRDLPAAVQGPLLETFSQQTLIVRLVTDARWRALARRTL